MSLESVHRSIMTSLSQSKDTLPPDQQYIRERNYKLKNAKHIFQYYEAKNGISSSSSSSSSFSTTNTETSKEPSIVSAKSLMMQQFFKKPTGVTATSNDNNNDNTSSNGTGTSTGTGNNSNGSGSSSNKPPTNWMELSISRYMRNVGENPEYYQQLMVMPNTTRHGCKQCEQGVMITSEEEGIIVCNRCYSVEPYLVDNDKPSYKEPPKETGYYAYRRINHFKEVKAQLQGKETTHISKEIMDEINAQLKKERLQVSRLNYQTMKNVLKKLNRSKLYDHINYILFVKFGLPPTIVIPPQLDELLDILFIELQEPYSVACPQDRTNFLHYPYVLYKLIELIAYAGLISPETEEQYLSNIPMLDWIKVLEQDCTWEPMCALLAWPYIPTVLRIW
jgi:hypothetical protein